MKTWAFVGAAGFFTAFAVAACADGSTSNESAGDDDLTSATDASVDSGKGKKTSVSTTLPATDDTGSGTDDQGTDDWAKIVDSGVTKDSGVKVVDSGVTPPASKDCDLSGTLKPTLYSAKYALGTLGDCPCSTGQCCYAPAGLALGCVSE